MANKRIQMDAFTSTIFFTSVLKVGSLLKVSFIVGSSCALLSASAMVAPLVGAFGGVTASCMVFAVLALIRVLFFGFDSFHIFAYFVPGFCASLVWARSSRVFGVAVSFICMGLFLANPVGMEAGAYALLWIIPAALYAFGSKNIFLTALASAFIAHAVGSVIWLYTVPMAPATWLALIPVAIVERLTLALGTTGLYYLLSYALQNVSARACMSRLQHLFVRHEV